MESEAYQVRFTSPAKADLKEILNFILENEHKEAARQIVIELRRQGDQQLKTLPFRGRAVPELENMTKEYRQIQVKPYRLIYRVFRDQKIVRIFLVAHTRRSIEDLLLNRLIFNQ